MRTFFPAKLLLFGEYTVLLGGQALAIPLHQFGGRWAYATDLSKQLDLPAFNDYLKNLVAKSEIAFDTEGVAEALSRGLFFDSNIPRGYGAGSSGALVAALYEQFGRDKALTNNDLKIILGKMEAYFHGSSSGFDPLISFIQKPILIQADKSLTVFDRIENDACLFLLDTKQPRKTEPFVELFKTKCEQTPQYASLVADELMPSVRDAITCYLENKAECLFESVHAISHFQYRFFSEMIPLDFQTIWRVGLSEDIFKLKLCGAGGGGFILGFAKDKAATQRILNQIGGYTGATIWF
jgi:mevalonate kinase